MKNFYSDDLPDFFSEPKNYHFKSNLLQTYPINYAASRGEVKIVKKLIGLGVDVNSPGDQGYTPLQEAASKGYIDVVKLLVDHGANLDLKNEFGKKRLRTCRIKR